MVGSDTYFRDVYHFVDWIHDVVSYRDEATGKGRLPSLLRGSAQLRYTSSLSDLEQIGLRYAPGNPRRRRGRRHPADPARPQHTESGKTWMVKAFDKNRHAKTACNIATCYAEAMPDAMRTESNLGADTSEADTNEVEESDVESNSGVPRKKAEMVGTLATTATKDARRSRSTT
ncbi:hypothetical protein LTR91_026049 [Friedmanniomyces endolithicus]|uniref:Uncharacterized protein n=1 Tax=Friedmanniomyces endolithicus TaxID=329885 RepID=A0AAN6GXM2_9PEZI|nr:hypothetical protein LTR57_023444 [Friedmanniomyces endolithicus]KAK0949936.1 hypothetical protein LTR91_026049 [Friedmanniomyces endolithicus]